MNHKMFAIYDTCVQSYSMPMYFVNEASAVRALGDVVNKPAEDSPYYQHPEHYQLFSLGEFDDETGLCNLLPAPVFVVACNSLVRTKQ